MKSIFTHLLILSLLIFVKSFAQEGRSLATTTLPIIQRAGTSTKEDDKTARIKVILDQLLANESLDLDARKRIIDKLTVLIAKETKLASKETTQQHVVLDSVASAGNFVREHPLPFAAAAAATVALGGIYYFSRPSFNYQDHSQFYSTVLNEQQRLKYKTLILAAKSPLLLLKKDTFLKSLTLAQKVELLVMARQYMESRESNAEERTKMQPFFQLFQESLLDELTLKHLDRKRFEHINNRYSRNQCNVENLKTFFIDQFPTTFTTHAQRGIAAAGYKNRMIYIWEFDQGRCTSVINTHFSGDITILKCDDAGRIYAVSSALEVTIFDGSGHQLMYRWKAPQEGAITSICFNQRGTLVALGTMRGHITVLDVLNNKVVASYNMQNHSKIGQLYFMDNDQLVGLAKKTAFSWHFLQPKGFRQFGKEVSCMDVRGNMCFTVENKVVKIYDRHCLLSRDILLLSHNDNASVICCSPELTHVAVAYKNEIEVRNMRSKKVICKFHSFLDGLKHMEFGNSYVHLLGDFLKEDEGKVALWRIKELAQEQTLPHWSANFVTLGLTVYGQLSENEKIKKWRPFCVIARDNPYRLLDNPDFQKVLKLMNAQERSTFSEILTNYIKERLIASIQRELSQEQIFVRIWMRDDPGNFLESIDENPLLNVEQKKAIKSYMTIAQRKIESHIALIEKIIT